MIPHNDQLECSLLGGLLNDPQNYPEVQDLFHEELFYNQSNKIVARAIKTLKNDNEAVNIVTVFQWVNSQGLGKVCEPAYISSLTSKGALTGFTKLVMLLNQFYVRRKIIISSHEIIGAAEQETCDIGELIADQEKSLNDIVTKITVGKIYDAQDCHLELIDHLDRLDKMKEGELSGIDTGFHDLNKLTSGWQNTDLVILAGRPGMGKTSFALNTIQSAINFKPTLVFSLEMGKMQLYARMCSQVTGIHLNKFLREKMAEGERKVFNANTFKLSRAPLYIEDRGGVNINYIKSKARKYKRDKNIGLLVIDYLGFVDREKGRGSTSDQVGEQTKQLKLLAKELDIPIICLCQMNRGSERTEGAEPELKDLRDSGNIEQDADMVVFIYRPEYYGITDDGAGNSTIGMAQVIVKKNRNGGLGTVFTGFDGKCTNFYNLNSPPVHLQTNENFLEQRF